MSKISKSEALKVVVADLLRTVVAGESKNATLKLVVGKNSCSGLEVTVRRDVCASPDNPYGEIFRASCNQIDCLSGTIEFSTESFNQREMHAAVFAYVQEKLARYPRCEYSITSSQPGGIFACRQEGLIEEINPRQLQLIDSSQVPCELQVRFYATHFPSPSRQTLPAF